MSEETRPSPVDLSLLEAELRGAAGIDELVLALKAMTDSLGRIELRLDRSNELLVQIAMGMGIRP